MMTFEDGLPDHFIAFSQTPKAQEHTRRIFVRFCLFLLLPLIASSLLEPPFSVSSCWECLLSFSLWAGVSGRIGNGFHSQSAPHTR